MNSMVATGKTKSSYVLSMSSCPPVFHFQYCHDGLLLDLDVETVVEVVLINSGNCDCLSCV